MFGEVKIEYVQLCFTILQKLGLDIICVQQERKVP